MSTARRLAAALGQRLKDDWSNRARPEQIPPSSAWSICLMLSGRGWGKTRAGSEWVRSIAESGAYRIALVAATASDCRDIMIEGESGILACCPPGDRPIYEPSKRRLSWKNGAIATAYSAEEADRLRGPQHHAAWCDELSAWNRLEQTWDMLSFGLRLGKNPQCLVTTTPRPIKILRDLVKRAERCRPSEFSLAHDCVTTPAEVVVIKGSTLDNRENLAPAFLSTILKRYENTRLYRQEINAEILEDIEGALWNWEMLEACRLDKSAVLPQMRRIVVAIDPAISVSEKSDATGMIVAGLGTDGHGYVLEDLSAKLSPVMWANKACSAYRRWKADRIIAEANQGGAMVETTLRAVDRNVPVRLVHASRGKITRAEPISALYEQRRVHHVGAFTELEDEMTTFEPGTPDSPDRMDALVWALSDLMVGFEQATNFAMPFVAERPRGYMQPGGGLPDILAPDYGDPNLAHGPEYESATDFAWRPPSGWSQ